MLNNRMYIVLRCGYGDGEVVQNIIGVASTKANAIILAKKEYNDCYKSMVETYGKDGVFVSQNENDFYEIREIDGNEIWQIEVTKIDDED